MNKNIYLVSSPVIFILYVYFWCYLTFSVLVDSIFITGFVLLHRKVEQIAEEAESLKESLDKFNLRNQKRISEAKERAELLGRAVCHFYHDLV